VTVHDVRAHLGVETQRQWSDLALLRTTPTLLALFSLVTIVAHHVLPGQPLPVRQAAWYAKARPTFSDTLAFVRQHRWPVTLSSLSPDTPDLVKIPRALFERVIQTLAFAASYGESLVKDLSENFRIEYLASSDMQRPACQRALKSRFVPILGSAHALEHSLPIRVGGGVPLDTSSQHVHDGGNRLSVRHVQATSLSLR
jgi:hypothetical protein